MRILEKKTSLGNRLAKLAIDIFVYRIRKYISAYIGVMAGADAIIFTAGIGTYQKKIRKRICQGLFSHLSKAPQVLVIPTNEELMICRQAYNLIKRQLDK